MFVCNLLLLLSILNEIFSYPSTSVKSDCPKLYPKVFKGYVPRGNISAGKKLML